jgi:hypothetical protein
MSGLLMRVSRAAARRPVAALLIVVALGLAGGEHVRLEGVGGVQGDRRLPPALRR